MFVAGVGGGATAADAAVVIDWLDTEGGAGMVEDLICAIGAAIDWLANGCGAADIGNFAFAFAMVGTFDVADKFGRWTDVVDIDIDGFGGK